MPGNENDLSGKVGLDISDFKSNISALNQQIKVIETGFKAAAAGMGDWGRDADGLQARIKSLTDIIDLQKQKVENLKEMYAKVAAEKGATSNAARDLEIRINNETAALNKNQAELKGTVDKLDNLGKEADGAGDELKQLGNNLDDAGKKALSFGDVLKANVIGNVITDGIRELGGAIKGLASDALNSADGIQQMADATGMSAEQVQEWTFAGDTLGTSIDTITGAQAKLTKTMNASRDGTGAQAEAFKTLGISATDSSGNLRDARTVMLEAFDALGSIGNETERDALSMAIFGKSAQDLNPLIKAGSDELNALAQQARDTGAVMSNDTVSNLDNFGDTMGQLKQSATAAAGSLLEKLLPSLQPIIDKVKTFDVTPIAIFLSFILNNAGAIAAGLGAIGVGFLVFNVATMIQGAVNAFKAFKLAQEGATIAQWAMNAAMSANPIGIVIAAITALVAGIVILWNTNEGFRNAVLAVWEALKSGVGTAIQAICDFFTKTVPNALGSLLGWFQSLPGKIGAALSGALGALATWVTNMASKAAAEVPKIITKIVSFFSSLPGKLFSVGSNLITGLWNGISDKVGWLKDQVSGVVDRIKGWFTGKKGFDEHSPSKWAHGVGEYVTQGLANGITSKSGLVNSAITNMAKGVKSIAEGILSNVDKAKNAASVVAVKAAVSVSGYSQIGAEMSATDKAMISRIQSMWSETMKNGSPLLAEELHKAAEKIRFRYGYSGGADGSQHIDVTVPLTLDGKAVTTATSQHQQSLNVSKSRSYGVVLA